MRPSMRVYLVDDNDAFRESTVWMLEAAGFEVEDYPGAQALLERYADAPPDRTDACIVTDLRMPQMSGLELVEALRQRRWILPVVFITAHGDVSMAVEAMRRGAANFVQKPCSDEALVAAIHGAVQQPGALPRNPQAAGERLARLSPRERQVLDLVCAGKLNKTIADVLGISIKTVELHRANMMTKLGARNLPEAVRLTLGYE